MIVGLSKLHGLGLFSDRDYIEGYVIGIIQGPVTDTPTDYAIEPKPGKFIETDYPWKVINHSCNPNIELLGERLIVTKRSVDRYEELTLDYSTFIHDDWSMVCACGHDRCRGTIRAYAS